VRAMKAALLLAALAALLFAGAARAEMPANRELPTITGPGVVGEVLLGNNGTWLYADGARCGYECTFSFRWESCSTHGCRTVSNQRGYRPRLADLHHDLRVEVTATKYDCGEWNYAAGTQECRFDGRTAYSEPVVIAARGRVAARRVAWPARLRIERALVRHGVLRVTVADTLGRLVQGATVTVGTRIRRTNADGTAVLAVPRIPSQVIARAGRLSARVRLSRS
jgi:hypothetical protein